MWVAISWSNFDSIQLVFNYLPATWCMYVSCVQWKLHEILQPKCVCVCVCFWGVGVVELVIF